MSRTFSEFLIKKPMKLVPHKSDIYRQYIFDTFCSGVSGVLERAAAAGRPFELELVFVDKPGLKAFAASFEDTDVIGLSRDLIPILLGTARCLMSYQDVYPGVRSAKVSPRSVEGTPLGVVYGYVSLSAEPLENPAREQIAVLMSRVAIWFILNHELAHITNGHTRWLNAQGLLSLIAEISDGDYPAIKNLERETLEWDADSFAVGSTLAAVLSPEVLTVEGRDAWKIPDRNEFGTTIDAIDCLTGALFICAKYFACRESRDVNDPGPRTHPHPLIRLYNAVSTVDHNISFRTGLPSEYGNHMVATFSILDQVWCEMFDDGVPINWEHSGPTFAAQIGRYERMWEQLHPELSKYNRGTRLAPAVSLPHPAFPNSGNVG